MTNTQETETRICGYCGSSLVGRWDHHASNVIGSDVCEVCWFENHTDHNDCQHDDDQCPWWFRSHVGPRDMCAVCHVDGCNPTRHGMRSYSE